MPLPGDDEGGHFWCRQGVSFACRLTVAGARRLSGILFHLARLGDARRASVVRARKALEQEARRAARRAVPPWAPRPGTQTVTVTAHRGRPLRAR